MHIPIRRLDPGLPLPAAQHDGDAGLDLYAARGAVLEPAGGRALVPDRHRDRDPGGLRGLRAAALGARAAARRDVLNTPGLIDAGYRDEIRVLLVNTDPIEPFKVERGDRIAQLVIQRVETVEWDEVDGSTTPSAASAAGARPALSEPRHGVAA